MKTHPLPSWRVIAALLCLFSPMVHAAAPALSDPETASQPDVTPPGSPSPSPRSPDLSTFEARRQALLKSFATEGTDHFMRAECLFTLGRTTEALVEVNKGLDALGVPS